LTLFEPVQGYLITASKLITLTAYQASFLKAPQIALWLTCDPLGQEGRLPQRVKPAASKLS
jgi:hypothetical protein